MSLTRGEKPGPYDILSSLGAGGMGEVYRARDTGLGRDVALKVLPATMAGDADRVARFEREDRTLASLRRGELVERTSQREGPMVRRVLSSSYQHQTCRLRR